MNRCDDPGRFNGRIIRRYAGFLLFKARWFPGRAFASLKVHLLPFSFGTTASFISLQMVFTGFLQLLARCALAPTPFQYTAVALPSLSNHGSPGTAMASRTPGFIKRFTIALLPHPIACRLAPHLYKPPRIHATSYLDGLRGIAAFIVMLHHYTDFVGPYTPYYGVDTTETRPSSLIQLPFIRVIYSGRPMVHVFFVISGFVLSKKPLKLARARKYGDLHTTISSSIFRRGLRLFLPAVASTFIVLLLIRTGWSQQQPVDGGFFAQVWDWMGVVFRITQGWDLDNMQQFRYDVHTWSLPVEMSMSMLLFVTITGLSRCKSSTRLGLMVVVMLYCFLSNHWAPVEFLGGAFIAEVDLIEEDKDSHSPSCIGSTGLEECVNDQIALDSNSTLLTVQKSPKWRGIALPLFWCSQIVVALFICGWPNQNVHQAPGLAWLAKHTPEPYYSSTPWYIIASLQIVFACQQLPLLQRLLSTEPIQYLASISFALYLMHGPIFDSFGSRVMDHIWDFAGFPGGSDGVREETAGAWQLFVVWIAGMFCLGIPSVWAADLFWRFIDRPCVNFARWLEGRCVEKEN